MILTSLCLYVVWYIHLLERLDVIINIFYFTDGYSGCLFWYTSRSLFGNVASLLMLDSTGGSSSTSSVKDGNPVTVTALESMEGEVLQLTQPVRLLFYVLCVQCVECYSVCVYVHVSACMHVCTCVCVCVRVCMHAWIYVHTV